MRAISKKDIERVAERAKAGEAPPLDAVLELVESHELLRAELLALRKVAEAAEEAYQAWRIGEPATIRAAAMRELGLSLEALPKKEGGT